MSPMTTIETLLDVDIRVGRVIKAEEFPSAHKPSYKLWIDFGDLGIRKSSAQITDFYTVDELKDRVVLAVVNLPSRQVADFVSRKSSCWESMTPTLIWDDKIAVVDLGADENRFSPGFLDGPLAGKDPGTLGAIKRTMFRAAARR